jgi:hypothetical protein
LEEITHGTSCITCVRTLPSSHALNQSCTHQNFARELPFTSPFLRDRTSIFYIIPARFPTPCQNRSACQHIRRYLHPEPLASAPGCSFIKLICLNPCIAAFWHSLTMTTTDMANVTTTIMASSVSMIMWRRRRALNQLRKSRDASLPWSCGFWSVL